MQVLNARFYNLKIDEGEECFSYLVKDLTDFDFSLLKEDGLDFLHLHELSPDYFIDPEDFLDVCGELIDDIVKVSRAAINSVKSLVADHKEKIEVFFEDNSASYFRNNGYNLSDSVEIYSSEEFFEELDDVEESIDAEGYFYLGDWYAALLTVKRFASMVEKIIS